jgi:hypothetical protein
MARDDEPGIIIEWADKVDVTQFGAYYRTTDGTAV